MISRGRSSRRYEAGAKMGRPLGEDNPLAVSFSQLLRGTVTHRIDYAGRLVTKSLTPPSIKATCSLEYSVYFPWAALLRRSSQALIFF